MKTTPLAVLVLVQCLVGAMVAPAPGQTFTLSNTTKNLGTTKVATRKVDGLTITFPEDEADVVELLLPDIAKYRAARRMGAKAETQAVIKAISAESIRENYRTQIPRLIALNAVDKKAFDARFDAALKEIVAFVGQWEEWSGDLSALNFWNYATGAIYEQDQRAVFPDISYGANPKTGGTDFTITPRHFNQAIGIDLRRPSAPTPFRLDLPLYYKPGTSAAELASSQRDLLAELPVSFQGVVPKLASTAQTFLTEAVLQSEIRAGYFTPAAAAAPEGEMLIRALARFYLFASLKFSGKITDDNVSEKLSELLFFQVPAEQEVATKFVRAFESLDPFSGKLPQQNPASAQLAVAASRIITLTLFKVAQGRDDDGSPILQKLRRDRSLPEYGFKSVASFTAVVEAVYPAKFKDTFLAARAELAAAPKMKVEASTEKVEPAAAAVVPAPPLPDRETQVFDGLTITHPAVLRAAVAKLGPELGRLSKEAQKRIAERFGKDLVPPVPITEATLESVRGVGLPVTREQADRYAMQGAMLANASQILVRIFEGDLVQIWFKDDLKSLLKEGRQIPGFSYDPGTDKATFAFSSSVDAKFGPDKPLTLDWLKGMLASQRAPAYPIILKDRGIADLKDADAQIAAIREDDTFLFELLQAAGTVTPEQLGIQRGELSLGEGSSTSQALFASVHELVETALVEQVIASADRRWFCEGVANLLAIRACDRQLGEPGGNVGLKVFESLFNPASLVKRAAEIDLAAWSAVENEPQKKDDELTHAHYYFATRVLLAATEGRDEAFLKTWIAKIHETPWNRANAATIIAAYDELTGTSLRDLIKKTVSAPVSAN